MAQVSLLEAVSVANVLHSFFSLPHRSQVLLHMPQCSKRSSTSGTQLFPSRVPQVFTTEIKAHPDQV